MPHLPAFMANAPSMSAGSHKMQDFFSNQGPPRSSPYTAPSITPYLSLRARLSQIWINRWTILLLLVLARTLIAISGIDYNLNSARREALSACSSVESMGSAMASMPHYMSQGVNELTAAGVEKSINGLMSMVTLGVTAIEEIIIFVINMFTQTYLCLITLAVSGSLHSVIGVLDSAQDQLNTLTSGLGDDMADVVGDFSKAYNSLVDTIKGATLGLGSGIDIPSLNVDDDITKLRNLQLPTDLDADLQKLNNSIPTFADVNNLTQTALRFPFEQVKNLINSSMGTYTFNRSLLPVPAKEQLSFCSDDDGIDDFFNKLEGIASVAKKVFIIVLLLGAILVCVPMAYREIRRWRTMKERSQLVGNGEHDPMDVVYIVQRPYTSTFGIKMSSGFQSTRRQVLVRWAVAYATSDAALFVLTLALAGLFSVLCQYILLRSLEKEVPALSNQVGVFADKVVTQLNNASMSWANEANKVISNTNNSINEDMFGWVNISTTAVNDTLNTFVEQTSDVLNKTFGGTILYDPITEVLNCLIGLKIASFQKGLTWVHDNAHIDIPLFRNDTFSLGAAASLAGDQQADSSFLATPGDEASDKITSAVARFINFLKSGLVTEAIISSVVLAIWLLVVLIGVIRALFLWFGHERVRGEGGPELVNTVAQTSGNDFRSNDQDRFRNFDNIPLDTYEHHPPQYTANEAKRQTHTSSSNTSNDVDDIVFSNAKSSTNPRTQRDSTLSGRHWGTDEKNQV